MTIRERQILNWIEENPMISQEELAHKAGITRSAVAVHISNLMKKGHIAGRGYVISGAAYVAVVGGVNIDIGGKPIRPLIARDSNPGKVSVSLGGVGRNIAHNLSLLGIHVRFLTAFGDDLHAQRIEADCADLGIDISHARKVAVASTSSYLYLNDADGDMVLAVSDMEICERITPDYIGANLSLLNNAQVVVADGNLPTETLEYLAEHCSAPIFADPVSVTKAEKLRPVLGRLNTLKPNRMEAELLSGVRITDERSMRLAAESHGINLSDCPESLREVTLEPADLRLVKAPLPQDRLQARQQPHADLDLPHARVRILHHAEIFDARCVRVLPQLEHHSDLAHHLVSKTYNALKHTFLFLDIILGIF